MRWSLALMVIGALLLLAACVSQSPLTTIETGSSVHFESRQASCTAINLGDGAVLTAGHCIGGVAMNVEGNLAFLTWVSAPFDVALLAVPGLQAPSAVLACRDPVIGEDVMLVGDTGWGRDIYTFGKVSRKPLVRENPRRLFLFDIDTAPGNSGAPIYAYDGRVIAMVIGLITDYGNMAVAIPSSVLCELVAGEGTISPS